jgi:nicotinamidase/pyrazinamidase
MQNDFITGSLPVHNAKEIIPNINTLIEDFQKHGDVIVFTRDWHPIDTTHFAVWPVHCVKDTEGAAFHPELKMPLEAYIISKGQASDDEDGYSGFSGATVDGKILDAILSYHKVERIYVVGVATDYCVMETAIDAAKFDYVVSVVRDATRTVKATDLENTLDELSYEGVDITTTAEVLKTEDV